MSQPAAILFDLDDTIITEGDRSAILLDVATDLADRMTPLAPAEVAARVEADLDAFWSTPAAAKAARLGAAFGIRQARESVIAATFTELGMAGMPQIATAFCDGFTARRSSGSRLFPGARETVEALKAAGVKLALVTNGAADIQRLKIQRFELAPLFDHIQIEGEHGFGKPEERAYRHAMSALGVGAAETWMVGDNLEWEVAAPQRLGIFGIWHDHKGRGLPPGATVRPDRIIGSIAELLDRSPAAARAVERRGPLG